MDIEQTVRETIARTLKLPVDAIEADSSAETLDTWDSLAQVNLIMALEQTFDVELDVEEVMSLNSVPAIVAHLKAEQVG